MTAYFHGGPPGLQSVEPQTGRRRPYPQPFYDPRRVYVTTLQALAAVYAAGWAVRARQPAGTVYQVEPVGDIDHDGAWWVDGGLLSLTSWSCDRARILATVGTVPASDFTALSHRASAAVTRVTAPAVMDEEAFLRRTIARAVAAGDDEGEVTRMVDCEMRRRRWRATMRAVAGIR